MKHNIKIIKTLASVAVLAFASNSAWAAGTTAGTGIDNTASISYSVSGTTQTPIASSPTGNSIPGTVGAPTSFVVDKKVDLLVTTGSGANVTPGSTAQSITYNVKNEGNSTEDFQLAVSQVATGDNFDSSACVFVTPLATALPVSIAAEATLAVTVECDIPVSSGTVVNGASAQLDLLASVTSAVETTGADTPGTVDVVFADDVGTLTDGDATTGLRNAAHSAVNSYTINTANLIVTKTSAVISDPFNLLVNPKRIPGATIEYTITVSNAAGASDATHLTVSDPLQNDLTFVSCAVSGPAVINAVAPIDAVPVTCANSVGLGTAGGTVTTSSFTLPGGGATANIETLTITATVN